METLMAEAAHLDDAVPDDERRDPSHRAGVAGWVKWISLAIIAVCVVLIVRLLPVQAAVAWLTDWTDRLGIWGPVVFGVAYVVAALLFVPGAALTLAAGAIFGLLVGTVTVSIAATIGAALAFLIARYFARSAVERKARAYPKFAAIDRAIGEEGWKIVALLRLSPAVPYSVGNYLYGLTSVRFWPYVLASWAGMLPGTFMYVYLGYLGKTGVVGGGGRTPGQWALLIVGLIATMAVTVYVTYIARKAVRRHTSNEVSTNAARGDEQAKPRGFGGAVIAGVVAVVFAGGTVYAYLNKTKLAALAGPPAAELKEQYERKPDGPTFDHAVLDGLLKKHVSEGGWVDYAALREDAKPLDRYIASLADAPFDELGRDEKLALLINGYNAFTLRLILDHYPLKSIKDIPAEKRWDARRWKIGGNTWSLTQIEHEQVRPKFEEPRIHFALVCAAVGCPPLRGEAYVGSRVEEQLEEQTRYVHDNDKWFRFEPQQNTAHLTSLYKWYGGDFEQVAGSVLKYAARYAPPLEAALDAGKEPKVEWQNYDWTLNDVKNRGQAQ